MRQDLRVDVGDAMLAGRISSFTAQKKPLGLVMSKEGFEPLTSWFVATCSNPLSYMPLYYVVYKCPQ